MGRINRLNARAAATAGVGYHADGAGLYLQVTAADARSWILRFMLRGRAREMGLGPLSLVSLAQARERAQEARRMIGQGVDPIDARERTRALHAHVFRAVAAEFIAANESGWRNEKHRAQWRNTLARYAKPVIGDVPVGQVTIDHALKILDPIWQAKAETASRVRQRCEAVLDYATARKYRTGDNPFRLRGALDKILPKSTRGERAHLAAMPYAEIPDFMTLLARQKGAAALALRFCILTCARSGEARGARWQEIDLDAAIWTVPPERMKGNREHIVPLSGPALAVVREMLPLAPESEFVFHYRRRAMSENALREVLVRMGIAERVTVHGFRSTFRDWAAEETDFPDWVAEMALAHAIRNKVEAAYRRGALLKKRRELADAWARYCTGG